MVSRLYIGSAQRDNTIPHGSARRRTAHLAFLARAIFCRVLAQQARVSQPGFYGKLGFSGLDYFGKRVKCIWRFELMSQLSILAHFDGERILLDEPVELAPDTKLIVTVLPNGDGEREAWLRLSRQRLQDAYGQDEAEYSLDLIREKNPEYEAR